ncbi:hypothetical protein CBL_03077 [Carabus blaptoides fortunei]
MDYLDPVLLSLRTLSTPVNRDQNRSSELLFLKDLLETKKLKYPHRKKKNLISTFKRTSTAATSSDEPWVRDSGRAISSTTCSALHAANHRSALVLSERRRAVPLSARLLAMPAPFHNFAHAAPILSWPSSANTNFSTSQIEKLPKTFQPINSLANCIF